VDRGAQVRAPNDREESTAQRTARTRQASFQIQPLATEDEDLEDHVLYLRDRDLDVALRFIDAFEILPRATRNPRLSGLLVWPVPRFERC